MVPWAPYSQPHHTIETATRTLRSAFRIQLPVAHAPSRICMSLTTSKLNKGNYISQKQQCNRLNFKTSWKTGCIGCMWVSVSCKLRYLEIKGWLKGHTFITFRNSIKGTATSAGPNMVQSSSTSRNLGGPMWPSRNKFVMSSGKLSASFSQAASAQMLQQTLSPNSKTLPLSDSLLNRLMAIDGLICLRRDQCFDWQSTCQD